MSAFLTSRKVVSRKSVLARVAMETLEERRLLTIYVDASSPAAAPTGMSWDTAYPDLQSALGAAVPGEIIRVADGVYKPTSGTDRTISFIWLSAQAADSCA